MTGKTQINMRIQQFKTEENQLRYLFDNDAEEPHIINGFNTDYIHDTAQYNHRKDMIKEA